MKLLAPYAYDTFSVSDAAAIPADGHGISMTDQTQAEDADINVILKRFKVTGVMPTSVRVPTFGDFTGVRNFHDAMSAIKSAQVSFMQMPADVRARFNNDPGMFVEFCSNSNNLAEMRKLGLAVPETVNPDPIST